MEFNCRDLTINRMDACRDINNIILIPKNRQKSTLLYYFDAIFDNESAPFTIECVFLNYLDGRRYLQELGRCPKSILFYYCGFIRDDTIDRTTDNLPGFFFHNYVATGIFIYRTISVNNNRKNGSIIKGDFVNLQGLRKCAYPQVFDTSTLKRSSTNAPNIRVNCDAIKALANSESPIFNYFQAIWEVDIGKGIAALKSILPNFNKPFREYNFFQILTISEAVVGDTADSFRNINPCKTKTFFKCPFSNFSQRGW